MFVIGTAGHVDHGKSTLVEALTGINPDRLAEEQAREMTIDLGFAWLTLPSGREVSIVDVPGHEDFIKNMLAGIGGIDIALLVVAADEAVMPQTREHLAILDLLGIPRGVIALSKSDLIEDPEWLELVAEEVREELQGTVLAGATIIPVSAFTGQGLSELLAEIDRLLDSATPRPDLGRPRLPVDRVFTISGFGTIVTGTLIDGMLRVGQDVEILPGRLSARIRGLQSHRTKIEEALPGSRVAVNLTGVSVDELTRGQVVISPGTFETTSLVDAHLRVVRNAPWPVQHNALVDFYSGAARVSARVRLLDANAIPPGESGWVQFRLLSPIVVARHDGYVIRSPSPSITLGGGVIAHPHPIRRHRRFRPEVIAHLQALLTGTPEETLLQLLEQQGIVSARELIGHSGLLPGEATSALEALLTDGRVCALGDERPPGDALATSGVLLLAKRTWDSLCKQMRETVALYHAQYPLRIGMPREELKSRLRLDSRPYALVLERAAAEGQLVLLPTMVRLPEHHVVLSSEQERAIQRTLQAFAKQPSTPPSLAQVEAELGAELLQVLLDDGRLVKVSDDVIFEAQAYAAMEQQVVAFLREHKSITVAQVRDLLNTNRRYALGLLEDLDRRRITKRVGDVRVLR